MSQSDQPQLDDALSNHGTRRRRKKPAPKQQDSALDDILTKSSPVSHESDPAPSAAQPASSEPRRPAAATPQSESEPASEPSAKSSPASTGQADHSATGESSPATANDAPQKTPKKANKAKPAPAPAAPARATPPPTRSPEDEVPVQASAADLKQPPTDTPKAAPTPPPAAAPKVSPPATTEPSLDDALGAHGGRMDLDPDEDDEDDETGAKPQGLGGPVEPAGHPIASASGRPGHAPKGGQGVWQPQQVPAARVQLDEDDANPAPPPGPAPFSPSQDADARTPLTESEAEVAGGSSVESAAKVGSADTRVAVKPGEPVEAPLPNTAFMPATDASDRVPVKPGEPVEAPLPNTAFMPATDASDRVPVKPGEPVEAPLPATPFMPSADADERVPLVFLPDIASAASVLEGYGSPTANVDERVGMMPLSVAAAGANVLEGYGVPSPTADERIMLDERPDAATLAGAQTAEAYGNPTAKADERVSLEEKPDDTTLAGARTAEAYGNPTAKADERVSLEEKPDDTTLAGARTAEAYGNPAAKADDRVSLADVPDDAKLAGAKTAESYGTPARDAGDRVDLEPKPDLSRGRTLESAAKTSAKPDDRVPLRPEPDDETAAAANVLESYGKPSPDRSDRSPTSPEPDYAAGATLDRYGQPSQTRGERVDLDPEPEVPEGSSTLGGADRLSKDKVDRLGRKEPLDAVVDGPPGNPPLSRDRVDRLGRKEPLDAVVDGPPGNPPLSRDRTDRLGRKEPLGSKDGPVGNPPLSRDRSDFVRPLDRAATEDSPIPLIAGSAAILDAGRMSLRQAPDRAFALQVPTGLESLMPHPGARGADRMRMLEDDDDEVIPPDLVGKVPVPLRKVDVVGRLQDDEKLGQCGEPRRLQKELVRRRIDFLYQRFEVLHVRRGVYTCPLCPDEPLYKAREPVFVTKRAPLGNGMLAQAIAAVYDDHASISDQAAMVDRFGFTIEDDRFAVALDEAAAQLAPILDAMRSELQASRARPAVDKKGMPTERPGKRKRTIKGELRFAHGPTVALLLHHDRGDREDDLLKGVPPSRRKTDLVRDLFRETISFNRAGVWAGVRRRFTQALVTSPRQAAYALFLIHAIRSASSQARGHHDELVRRSRALRAWLDDQRDAFDDPETALQRAVVYALTSWDRMRLVDDAGDGDTIDEPPPRRFPKTYSPVWPMESDAAVVRATTFYSIVATCRILGVRPWEYLFGVFTALSRGELDDPRTFTPAAWAESAGA